MRLKNKIYDDNLEKLRFDLYPGELIKVSIRFLLLPDCLMGFLNIFLMEKFCRNNFDIMSIIDQCIT